MNKIEYKTLAELEKEDKEEFNKRLNILHAQVSKALNPVLGKLKFHENNKKLD